MFRASGQLTNECADRTAVGIVGVLLATGTKLSSRVSAVAVAIKLSVIVLILVVGATYFKASNLTPFIPAAQPSAKADGVHQSMLAWLTGTGGTSFGWLGRGSRAMMSWRRGISF